MKELYFKSEFHEELFNKFLILLKKKDKEYITFAYLASASGKSNLINYLFSDRIETNKIKQLIKPYSQGEIYLITLALHLFNPIHKTESIDKIFTYLDDDNKKVVIQALKFRYF